MLDALAQGLKEAKARALVGPALQLDAFLDTMLRSRITRRVLAEQHLGISGGGGGVVEGALGVADAAEFAGQRAAMLCAEVYGVAPEVRVSGDTQAVLPYIPSHLDYMMYEVLKNAVRATVERHTAGGRAPSPRLPPVLVRVCAGRDALCLRISDAGGGIPQEHLSSVWAYGFTTCSDTGSSSGANSGNSGGGTDGEAPAADAAAARPGRGLGLAEVSEAPRQRYKLAGLGFGLPLSRLYARYFGGDLALQNLPGYGVDAYLTLKNLRHLSRDWSERDHS
ncbi:pyruvate dehydrogenase kinase [Monoraphidium neglectum]|uniref:Protein-serine/threonine kinase n=1 Tax=Monoraphidium neglectum TaxID=145388 RepID=A0A0D2MA63_9CHLO|nr:pyruvate dehydrogenase kinase [Monoraphidium neglectum]KIY97851.1 pyruvate dehydrogenase kinase [Monoraphidium neglectum]|eukprot:XP_013896871.1 pyruvate dehydrogenase kinase [Monoraphidium neglectum]